MAESVAERVHEALQEPFNLNGTEFIASGSVGISLFPQDALDAATLLKNADAAMYQSKKQDPGGYVVYATSGEDPMKKLSMTTRLRRAVEQENWVLHYQPVVNLLDGSVEGVEALVRWQDPNGGIVPPGEFIPLAEELGLIEAIGDWVIDAMAAQQRAWAADGLDLKVGFNLSPRQLWSAHLAEKVLAKLRGADVDPERVVVEITESTAMADPDRTQKILNELHAWGLTLAIDDFGTGLLVAGSPQAPARRHPQDRPLVRPRRAPGPRPRIHGPGDDPAGRRPGDDPARRRDRDRGRARVPPGSRVPDRARASTSPVRCPPTRSPPW